MSPSLTTLLGKLHPSYKEQIVLKLGIIIDVINPQVQIPPDKPTFKEAYQFLGRLSYRKRLIDEVKQLIVDGLGTYTRTAQEIHDLDENCNGQIELMYQLLTIMLREETDNGPHTQGHSGEITGVVETSEAL
jgi:hypothetical protein